METAEGEGAASPDRQNLANIAVLLCAALALWWVAAGAASGVWARLPSVELPSLDERVATITPTPGPFGDANAPFAPSGDGAASPGPWDEIEGDEVDLDRALERPLIGATPVPARTAIEPYAGLSEALDPSCSGPDADARLCPKGMAFVPSCGGFCIDRFEASRGADGLPASVAGARPWTGIDWLAAKGACESAGKRLCRDREWMAACDLDGERYFLTEEEDGESYGCHTLCPSGACANDDTGAHRDCRSRSGVFDMVGNALEWTDALVPDGPWAGADTYVGPLLGEHASVYGDDYLYRVEEEGAGNAFLRGGGRTDVAEDSPDAGCFYLAIDEPPTAVRDDVGFRCCKDAE